jgi:hypothetical protein
MPMKSQSQRAFLNIHHPGIAKRFEAETPNKKLPYHVGKDGKGPLSKMFGKER